MRIVLGEWAPDVADFGTETLDIARNVYPGPNSWKPVKGLVTQSSALPAAPKSPPTYVQKSDGSYDTYAGTTTGLYKFNSATQAWDDVTRLVGGAYNVPSEDLWSLALFGHYLIAVNLNDVPQVMEIDAGSNFSALAGSPPQAKFVTVMDDKVVMSQLSTNGRAIQWSDINDMEEWSGGVADSQEFPDHGLVQSFCPHARLVILERGLRAVVSTGDVSSFQFPELTSAKGTIAPYAVIEVGSLAWWLSEDGFYIGNSNEQKAISHNRVTGYFFEELNRDRIWQIQAAEDPFATRIYFSYPTGDTAYNDRILGLDWSLDRFFEIEADTYVMARSATAGTTLEGLDSISASLDAMTITWDSRIYMGGAPVLGAIDTDFKLAYFEGANLEAILETGTYQFVEDSRARMRSAILHIEGMDGEDATLQVAKRTRLSDAWSYSAAITQQTSGRYPMNADGALHRFKATIPAGIDWDHVQGLQVDFVETSWR